MQKTEKVTTKIKILQSGEANLMGAFPQIQRYTTSTPILLVINKAQR